MKAINRAVGNSENLEGQLDFVSILLTSGKDRREGWTDARSAVGFCLGSGLFGSYNSD